MSEYDTPKDRSDAVAEAAPEEAVPEGDAETVAEPAQLDGELDILRAEFATAQAALELVEAERDEAHTKFLRARADLENVRRRSAADIERAREAGLDSAVLTVLSVYDDLVRALEVADEGDPGKIIPGVRAVNDSLERRLEALGIVRVGDIGDPFDPDLHEALTAMPTDDAERADTIAQVFEAGFKRGDRLVRPARVVVYQAQ